MEESTALKPGRIKYRRFAIDAYPDTTVRFIWQLWHYQPSNVETAGNDPNSKDPFNLLTPELIPGTTQLNEEFSKVECPKRRLLPCESFLMFKKDILPYAYDPSNKNGGQWTITFGKKDSWFDEAWKELVQSVMIQDLFDHDDMDEICGAVATQGRIKNYIQIWTKNSENCIVNYRIMETVFNELKLEYLMDDILYHEHFQPFQPQEKLLVFRRFL